MGLPKLTKDRANKKLGDQHREILCLDEPNGFSNKVRWKCGSCKNIWSSTPHTILTNRHGCPQCKLITNEKIDRFLKVNNLNIQRLDDYTKSNTPIRWSCEKCKNIWKTSPNCILNRRTKCPRCSKKKKLTNNYIDNELVKNNIPFKRLGNVKNTHSKIKWMCEREHKWEATPVSVIRKRTGCPYCYAKEGGRGFPSKIDGKYFRSQLEANAYKKLKTFTKKHKYTLECQCRYNNTTQHKCDFYIPELSAWIEVSNYSDHTYLKNIEQKRQWVLKMNENFYFTDDVEKLNLIF